MNERFNPLEYSIGLKLPSPTATMVMMIFEATAHRLTPYRSMADVMRRVGCKKHAFKRCNIAKSDMTLEEWRGQQ